MSDNEIDVTVNVANTGARTGVDVVQAYVKDPAKLDEPPEQLKSFLRVSLDPGVSQTVTLSIPLSSLNVYVDGGMRTLAGTYGVSIGQSSANLPLTVQVKIPSALTDSLNASNRSDAGSGGSAIEKDAISLPGWGQSALAR